MTFFHMFSYAKEYYRKPIIFMEAIVTYKHNMYNLYSFRTIYYLFEVNIRSEKYLKLTLIDIILSLINCKKLQITINEFLFGSTIQHFN